LQNAKESTRHKLGIKSSIYYVYDNRYYNAFNDDDINALISTMKSSYYGIYDKKLDGTSSDTVRTFSGDRELFYALNKRELLKDFKNNYYRKIIDFDKSHRIILKLRNDVSMTINGHKYYNLVDYNLGSDVTIDNVPVLFSRLQNKSF